jgi:uncharacterized protein DUF4333
MSIARGRGLGLVLASSVLIVACGGSTVDVAAVEKNVRDTINGPGSVKVDTVDCPEDQVATVGKTFACAYDLTDGSSGEITVLVADEDGTGRWDVTRPASGQAEQVVLTGYARKIGRQPKSVQCPDPLKTGKKKTTCVVEFANGETQDVTLRVKDGGDIRWQTR